MGYQMDPEKSGVLVYFDPMRDVADALSDEQLAKLTRAILHYADPAKMEEPQFEDETLSKVWIFVRSIIIRDDKTYRVKNAKKRYAAFCRYSKESGYDPPIDRDTWDSLGQPDYKQFAKWQKEQLQCAGMQSNATQCNGMQSNATQSNALQRTAPQSNAVQRMPYSYAPSPSTSFSGSTSPSVSVSASSADAAAADAGDASERPAPFVSLTPSLMNVCQQWAMHWEQVTGRTFPQSSRDALAKNVRTYADGYGAEAVVSLIEEAVASAYKSIPWDRLERRRAEANGAENGSGNASAVDTLQALHAKYAEEEGL